MLKGKKRLLIAGCALIAIAVMLITYVVLIALGIINVLPNTLVIRAGTAEKPYDGEALVCEEWFIEHGELKEGHTLIPLFSGSQTTPGQSANKVTVRIVDANQVDVTEEYRIEYLDGTLSVYTTQLRFVSTDFSKEYDGQTLTAPSDSCYLELGALRQGHDFRVTITGSQTSVGSSDNTFTVTIFDGEGKDVTDQYILEHTYGVLEVVSRPLTVQSDSKTQTYDGLPLTAESSQITEGSLVEGHTLSCIYMAEQTEVGNCENSVEVQILDENGANVTSSYALDIICGLLEIQPRPITVRSASAKMKLSDMALTAPRAMVVQGSLANGHQLSCSFWGSQHGLGVSENFFSVDILDSEGISVLANYELTTMTGVLAVVEFIPHDDPDASPPMTSPENNSSINGSTPDGTTEVLALQSNAAGPAYLRLQHFGSYNTNHFGWDQAPSLTEEVCGSNPLYWLSSALDQSGSELSSMSITWLVDSRGLLTPYYPHTNYSVGVDDSYIPDGRWDYVIDRYAFDVLDTLTGRTSSLALPAELTAAEAAYREHVYANYLQMPGTYVDEVIWSHIKGNISPTSPTLIRDVAAYVRGVASYNLEAAPAPEGMDPIIFFLEQQEGVCRHYASTAVLMYRALGVPARYVVGYMANLPANELVLVTNMQAHAWVEVYIDGLGWVPVEVTGGSGSGTDGDMSNGGGTGSGSGSISASDRIPLIAKPADVYGTADGTEYRAVSYHLVGNLQEDHEFLCTFGGSLSQPGTTASYMESYRILHRITKEDVTHLYQVETLEGTITVVDQSNGQELPEAPIWLVIKPVDRQATYSGQPLRPEAWEYLPNSGVLMEGHTLVCTFGGEQTAPGTAAGTILTHSVTDKDGNDVTALYELTYREGELKVLPSESYLIVKPVTVWGVENGESWFATQWEYATESGDRLLPSHTLTCEFSGARSKSGVSVSYIAGYTIVDEQGQDVSDCYSVVLMPGQIVVRIPLTVKPQDVVAGADGTLWTASDWEYAPSNSGELLSGHQMYCEYSGSLAAVGMTESYIDSYQVLDENGEDVTRFYYVTVEPGLIHVKTQIHVKPADVDQLVNGNSWSATEWEYAPHTPGTLLPDHTLHCEYDGSQTDVGIGISTIHSFVILDGDGNDVTDSYVVKTEPGVIRVRMPITIKPVNVVGLPNGTVYVATEWEYGTGNTGQLLEGHSLTCTYGGSLSVLGTTESYITSVTVIDTETGEDVTGYYDVTIETGFITVVDLIRIKPVDREEMYSGSLYAPTEWEYTEDSPHLPDHHAFVDVTFDGSATYPLWPDDSIEDDLEYFEASKHKTSITGYRIVDTETGEDVTDQYRVQCEEGYIIIQGLLIEIKPENYQAGYTGQLHVPDQYTVEALTTIDDSTDWLNQYRIEVILGGSRTEYGSNPITVDNVTVYDENGNDVTAAFHVRKHSATLYICADILVFRTGGTHRVYDGTALTNSDWELLSGTLIEGHTLSVSMNAAITNVGSVRNTPTVTILDENGEDVTSWYFFDTSHYGTLSVEKATIIVTSGSATAPYAPGYTLTCDSFTVEGELADGEEVTAKNTGAQSMPGRSENFLSWRDVKVYRDGRETTANYIIVIQTGTLEVTPP